MHRCARRDFVKTFGIGLALSRFSEVGGQSDQARLLDRMPAESFVDFLEGYGTEHPPSLVYREGQDFRAWQRAFREKLESLRGPLPRRVNPEVEILEATQLSGHSRLLLRFTVTKFSRLLAYLLIPKGICRKEKRPAILASHGHHLHGIETI